jgi:cytoskeleton protein RodZ
VPDQSGLILATGNAGGLDVLVNGQKAPPLGGVGHVVKRITLEPGRLLAGTATPN